MSSPLARLHAAKIYRLGTSDEISLKRFEQKLDKILSSYQHAESEEFKRMEIESDCLRSALHSLIEAIEQAGLGKQFKEQIYEAHKTMWPDREDHYDGKRC